MYFTYTEKKIVLIIIFFIEIFKYLKYDILNL